jgi:hypothetical protein
MISVNGPSGADQEAIVTIVGNQAYWPIGPSRGKCPEDLATMTDTAKDTTRSLGPPDDDVPDNIRNW